MLSYQHSYHAGNFADVHKHLSLSLIFNALNKKAKPWSYLETHSGTALYDLQGEHAQKTGEYLQGIERLRTGAQSGLLQQYLEAVASFNTADGQLAYYPGSPSLAAHFAREDDVISLMELHPGEVELLRAVFKRNQQVAVHHRDGYEGVASLLPPKPNRGLVLVDPSYEVKDEYLQVATFLRKAHLRWGNACYAIWYPLLKAGNHREMLRRIEHSGIRRVLKSEFCVKDAGDERMYGSGMLLINPPWQLDEQLEEACAVLFDQLATPDAAAPVTQWLVPE
ncbi:MAG: 23S rRNA (adenine(2030)-N(6))-methyltransferase RlmJ [Pseudomonadales bacterium]